MIKSHMSNNKVAYPSDQAVTWGHGTNKVHYIFILFIYFTFIIYLFYNFIYLQNWPGDGLWN